MAVPSTRHEPCEILRANNIPCLVWFEDAIARYGVPTVVFELHLLVPDIDEATDALMANRWTDAAPLKRTYHFLKGPPTISHRRLNPPAIAMGNANETGKVPPGPTTTVLLRAADWNVSIDDLRASFPESVVPPLRLLLDALIGSLLDSPTDTSLSSYLGLQLSYLYGHCASLKTQDFAAQLKLEHRQFHYDALTNLGLGSIPFVKEQQHIRDEIREGKRQPQRSSWYLPPSRN